LVLARIYAEKKVWIVVVKLLALLKVIVAQTTKNAKVLQFKILINSKYVKTLYQIVIYAISLSMGNLNVVNAPMVVI
jgi:hypothetical protein